jgi:hypothetical protein
MVEIVTVQGDILKSLCFFHRQTHYEDEVEGRQLAATEGADQGTTQREGHWEGPGWYCWD